MCPWCSLVACGVQWGERKSMRDGAVRCCGAEIGIRAKVIQCLGICQFYECAPYLACHLDFGTAVDERNVRIHVPDMCVQ